MFIYVIVNKETLKIYIGQHKGESLDWYLTRKFWDANHHTSGTQSRIYASMRKHPREVWSISPLISGVASRQELDALEQHYIRVLKTQHPDVGYNICRGGEGGIGRQRGFKHSMDTRRQMGQSAQGNQNGLGSRHPHSEAAKRKMSVAHLGKRLTAEHRAKISAANSGRQFTLGHKLTQDHRDKIQAALRGRIFTPEWKLKISQAKRKQL